jgi:hypothetical protein
MNILSDVFELERVPQPECVFVDDPIALSCAAYRLWQKNPVDRWPDLNDMVLDPQDREQSQAIRKYYADRLIMSLLQQEHAISSFRRNLYGLVTDSIRLKKNEIGMVYRLPYFYAEDTALDQVVADTTSAEVYRMGDEFTGEFVLKQRITKSRRSGEFVQFWLTRTGDTAAYGVMMKSDNPLLSLLTSVLDRPVTLKARAWTKPFRGHHRDRMYYQLGDLKLV